MMLTRKAEYVQPRHQAHGIPAHEMIRAPEVPGQGSESAQVVQLPWPRNLFGRLASIADLMGD
jgi:hypothetical protein